MAATAALVIIIVLIIIILLAVGGYFAWKKFFSGKPAQTISNLGLVVTAPIDGPKTAYYFWTAVSGLPSDYVYGYNLYNYDMTDTLRYISSPNPKVPITEGGTTTGTVVTISDPADGEWYTIDVWIQDSAGNKGTVSSNTSSILFEPVINQITSNFDGNKLFVNLSFDVPVTTVNGITLSGDQGQEILSTDQAQMGNGSQQSNWSLVYKPSKLKKSRTLTITAIDVMKTTTLQNTEASKKTYNLSTNTSVSMSAPFNGVVTGISLGYKPGGPLLPPGTRF